MVEICALHNMTSEEFDLGWQSAPDPVPLGAAIVTIEPWLADKLRALPIPNRPLKPRQHQRIMAALRGNYWYTNGESIILDDAFAVLDGKNRLQSCIETKLPLESLVTWGWSRDVFASINNASKRSGGDTLAAAGQSNPYALGAAARYDWRLTTGNMLTDEDLPDPLIEGYLVLHPGLKEAVPYGKITAQFIPKTMGIALFYRCALQDAALARRFFREIAHGEDINRNHTTYHLRNVLLRYRKQGERYGLRLSRVTQATVAASVLKGWHAICAGKLASEPRLVWHLRNNERFPELPHAPQE